MREWVDHIVRQTNERWTAKVLNGYPLDGNVRPSKGPIPSSDHKNPIPYSANIPLKDPISYLDYSKGSDNIFGLH